MKQYIEYIDNNLVCIFSNCFAVIGVLGLKYDHFSIASLSARLHVFLCSVWQAKQRDWQIGCGSNSQR